MNLSEVGDRKVSPTSTFTPQGCGQCSKAQDAQAA